MSRKVFETWPVKEVPMTCIGHPDSTQFFQCPPEDATAFGVYFRIDGEGPAEWVGDCPTAEAAAAAVAKLNRAVGNPDLANPSNTGRAIMANRAIHVRFDYLPDIEEVDASDIVDLLVNLRHLCDRTVFDFDQLNATAAQHHKEEAQYA